MYACWKNVSGRFRRWETVLYGAISTRAGTIKPMSDASYASASDGSPSSSDVLFDVRGLTKRFAILKGSFNREAGAIQAVSGVDLAIRAGETLGLVGESGCGKSTLGRCLLQLTRPSAGQTIFQGLDLAQLSERRLRPVRRQMQIVFQNPYSSLNPRMRIGDALAEPF